MRSEGIQGCSSSSPRPQQGGDTAHDLSDCSRDRPAAGHGLDGRHSSPLPLPIAGPRWCHPTKSPSRRRASPGAAHPSKQAACTSQQSGGGGASAAGTDLEEASKRPSEMPYDAHVRPANRFQPSWGLGNLLRTSRQTTPFWRRKGHFCGHFVPKPGKTGPKHAAFVPQQGASTGFSLTAAASCQANRGQSGGGRRPSTSAVFRLTSPLEGAPAGQPSDSVTAVSR